MDEDLLNSWPRTYQEAVALQVALRRQGIQRLDHGVAGWKLIKRDGAFIYSAELVRG